MKTSITQQIKARFKRWNIWRKHCINPWYHKLTVLFGVSYSPTMAYIVVKGTCPVCGKELGEDDCIFLCRECIRKDKEYHEQSKIQETNES